MKRIMILLMAILLSFSALAAQFYVSVHYDEQVVDSTAEVYYNVHNTFDSKAEDVSFKMYMPELDIYEVSPQFDLKSDESYSGFLLADFEGVAPGEYLVKFVAQNDDEKRVKYRYIFIE